VGSVGEAGVPGGPEERRALDPRESALPGSPSHLVIVRQGEEGVYQALRESIGRSGRVEIIWDRRREDRRRAKVGVRDDRRSQDRRAAPASTWSSIGFIMSPFYFCRGACRG
jgi:hypothetical protein